MEELHAEMDMESIEHIQNLNAYFVIGFDCQRNEIKRINTERKEKTNKRRSLNHDSIYKQSRFRSYFHSK